MANPSLAVKGTLMLMVRRWGVGVTIYGSGFGSEGNEEEEEDGKPSPGRQPAGWAPPW